jgi:hypothetical protein
MNRFNLGVEKRLSGNTLSIFYVSAIGQHLGRTFNDINSPPPNTSPDANTLRPLYAKDPNLTSVKYRDSGGYLSYSAMQARFSHSSAKADGSLFKERTARYVSLQIRAAVFNLTNTANFASPNSALGGANFGQLTRN